jgi:hypothetical protein
MKKIKIFNLFVLLSAGLFLNSCSEKALDEVNRDRNHPTDVTAKFILTDAMTSTAFSVIGGDMSLYASIYLEHEAGVWNQAFNAEMRVGEPTSATTYNNSWNSVYNNIKALKIAVAKTSEGGSEAGNNITGGIAKVLLAYNLAVLTDIYGDTPYYQTGIMNPNGSPAFLQPEINKQSALYPEVQKLLDEAITQLAGTDAAGTGGVGAQDVIYNGSKALWTKAAYGLKARYTMRTLKVSANPNGDLAKVLEYANKSFANAGEEMSFDLYDGSTNINPLFGISNSRDMLGASKSLATRFKSLGDPRGDFAFINYDGDVLTVDDAIAEGVENGSAEQVQFTYPIAMVDYASTAPTQLLSYHEVMFLKAEALVRLNRNEEAQSALKTAVVSAFSNLEQSLNSGYEQFGIDTTADLSGKVESYFTDKVLPRFQQGALKEVVLQKYLAFFGASGESTEAYNDYRRLKALGQESFIGLSNPLNAQNKFPLRFSYGNSDVTANQAVKAAYGDGQYVYTENVWWAGGTR